MRRKLAGLAAVGAVLVGCGGSSPEDVVRDTLDAFAEGDGETVCENIAEEGEDKTSALLFLALAAGLPAERISDPPEGDPLARCAYVAERVGPAIPNLSEVRNAEATDVDVSGNTAVVDLGGLEPFELEERNGDWKLTNWGPLAASSDTSESTAPPSDPPPSETESLVEPEPTPEFTEGTQLESVAAKLGTMCLDRATGDDADNHDERVAEFVPQFADAYQASPQSGDDQNLLAVAIDNLESGCGTSEQAEMLRELK